MVVLALQSKGHEEVRFRGIILRRYRRFPCLL